MGQYFLYSVQLNTNIMPYLTWVDDAVLVAAVKGLLQVAERAKNDASKKFRNNVVDPFSAIFEIAGFKMSFDDWIKSEEARQAQKTLQNQVGSFHQTILGSCAGWTNMNVGNIIDLLNTNDKIIAEVKNKHNTITKAKLGNLYTALESAVMPKLSTYKGYKAYYVTIIPSKPNRFDNEFTPSDPETGNKCAVNPLIREIDGASFYDIVTKEENALEKLFDILPKVIEDLTKSPAANTAKVKEIFDWAYKAEPEEEVNVEEAQNAEEPKKNILTKKPRKGKGPGFVFVD